MVKYVKLIIEDDVDMKHIMSLAREFASTNFKKSAIYAWNTETTDDTYHASFPKPTPVEPCGREVGKVGSRHLICGADDYICPDCKQQ